MCATEIEWSRCIVGEEAYNGREGRRGEEAAESERPEVAALHLHHGQTDEEHVDSQYERTDSEGIDKQPFGELGSNGASGVLNGFARSNYLGCSTAMSHALVGTVVEHE